MAEQEKEKSVPVEVGAVRMWMSFRKPAEEKEPLSMVPRIFFALCLRMPLSVQVGLHQVSGVQTLYADDSTGKKLGRVEFDLSSLATFECDGKHVAFLESERSCPSLPSPAATWVRLKGNLNFSVESIAKSPVYDFSLQGGGAVFPVALCGERKEEAGDIAVMGEPEGVELLSIRVEESKGPGVRLKVSLDSEEKYQIYAWEVLDGRGRLLSASRGSSMLKLFDDRCITSGYIVIPPGTDRERLKIRLRYLDGVKPVSLPVDMKLGVGGAENGQGSLFH